MEKKHSKLGITSSIIGAVNIAGLILFLLYINYYLNKDFNPDTIMGAAFGSIFAGVMFIIILFVGFVLAIISLLQGNTKKHFGVLGLALAVAGAVIFTVMVLMFSLAGPRL
jgi:hypothetical protein